MRATRQRWAAARALGTAHACPWEPCRASSGSGRPRRGPSGRVHPLGAASVGPDRKVDRAGVGSERTAGAAGQGAASAGRDEELEECRGDEILLHWPGHDPTKSKGWEGERPSGIGGPARGLLPIPGGGSLLRPFPYGFFLRIRYHTTSMMIASSNHHHQLTGRPPSPPALAPPPPALAPPPATVPTAWGGFMPT